nr:DUF2807 domain-containing protein [Odoribacter sp.]
GLVLLVLVLSSWNLKKEVKGSGKVLQEQREVTSFEGINVNNAIHVFLSPGNKESVKVEADDNVVPYIQTKVKDGILHITLKGEEPIRNFLPKLPMNVYVTIRNLREIEANAAATVEGESAFQVETLELDISSAASLDLEVKGENIDMDISSAANVTLSGQINNIKAEASGACKLNGANLETLKANIDMSGASSATLKVKDELEYNVSGASRLTYSGNPRIYKAEITSAGSVKKK